VGDKPPAHIPLHTWCSGLEQMVRRVEHPVVHMTAQENAIKTHGLCQGETECIMIGTGEPRPRRHKTVPVQRPPRCRHGDDRSAGHGRGSALEKGGGTQHNDLKSSHKEKHPRAFLIAGPECQGGAHLCDSAEQGQHGSTDALRKDVNSSRVSEVALLPNYQAQARH
jgi:hypothetical protein